MSIFEVKINITVNISIYYRHLHIHKYSRRAKFAGHSLTHLARTHSLTRGKRSVTNTAMENRARPTAAAAANRRLKRNTHQNPVGNDALNRRVCLLQAALTIRFSRPTETIFVASICLFFCVCSSLPLSIGVFVPFLFLYLKHNLSPRVNKNN